MKRFDFNNPVTILTGDEFLPIEGVTFAEQVLDFFISQGGIAKSPWGDVLLDYKGIRRLYLHEAFLTEKIPEIAASSLVHGNTASPQSQGSIAKVLSFLFKSK